MAASIVEGADPSAFVSNYEDRIFANLKRDVAASLWQFALVSDEQPLAIPNQLHIELEEPGIRIEWPRE
jgi:hypothetical protein